MYHLGLCYESGYGCKADPDEAARWFEKAASYGDQKSYEHLIKIVANPALMDDIFKYGYVAPCA